MVRAPVGPVFFGSTAVGADDDVAIVAPKSGCVGAREVCSGLRTGGGVAAEAGGVSGADARNVAFGSKGCSATNKTTVDGAKLLIVIRESATTLWATLHETGSTLLCFEFKR